MSMKDKLLRAAELSDPSFMSADRANLLEILQRSRRIETRLTRFLEAEGIQTGMQRPWWTDNRVMIPSPTTTIDAVLKCIPENWPDEVEIILKEEQRLKVLCSIMLE